MKKNTKKTPHSKRYLDAAATVSVDSYYDVDEAVALVKKNATAKFPESIDLAIRLGIDTKKGDQNVRGITNLPHGTGKVRKIAVLAKGELAKEAEEAGADIVGDDDLIKKIQEGFKDFDVVMATEEMAPQIGKIGRMLGPKTPNKKSGTVTNNIGTAVKEIKGATRAEYRADKAGVVHMAIGKATYSEDQIKENLLAAMDAIVKAKPSGAKGKYLETATISSSMGPGVKLDTTLISKQLA